MTAPELTADELARVATFDAAPALAETSPIVRAVLAWAAEDDERRDGYGYRVRNGLDPSPGDEIRAIVAAVLAADPEPRGVAEALADVDRAARAMWAAEHGVSLDGWALVMATTREHWRLLAAAALDASHGGTA